MNKHPKKDPIPQSFTSPRVWMKEVQKLSSSFGALEHALSYAERDAEFKRPEPRTLKKHHQACKNFRKAIDQYILEPSDQSQPPSESWPPERASQSLNEIVTTLEQSYDADGLERLNRLLADGDEKEAEPQLATPLKRLVPEIEQSLAAIKAYYTQWHHHPNQEAQQATYREFKHLEQEHNTGSCAAFIDVEGMTLQHLADYLEEVRNKLKTSEGYFIANNVYIEVKHKDGRITVSTTASKFSLLPWKMAQGRYREKHGLCEGFQVCADKLKEKSSIRISGFDPKHREIPAWKYLSAYTHILTNFDPPVGKKISIQLPQKAKDDFESSNMPNLWSVLKGLFGQKDDKYKIQHGVFYWARWKLNPLWQISRLTGADDFRQYAIAKKLEILHSETLDRMFSSEEEAKSPVMIPNDPLACMLYTLYNANEGEYSQWDRAVLIASIYTEMTIETFVRLLTHVDKAIFVENQKKSPDLSKLEVLRSMRQGLMQGYLKDVLPITTKAVQLVSNPNDQIAKALNHLAHQDQLFDNLSKNGSLLLQLTGYHDSGAALLGDAKDTPLTISTGAKRYLQKKLGSSPKASRDPLLQRHLRENLGTPELRIEAEEEIRQAVAQGKLDLDRAEQSIAVMHDYAGSSRAERRIVEPQLEQSYRNLIPEEKDALSPLDRDGAVNGQFVQHFKNHIVNDFISINPSTGNPFPQWVGQGLLAQDQGSSATAGTALDSLSSPSPSHQGESQIRLQRGLNTYFDALSDRCNSVTERHNLFEALQDATNEGLQMPQVNAQTQPALQQLMGFIREDVAQRYDACVYEIEQIKNEQDYGNNSNIQML